MESLLIGIHVVAAIAITGLVLMQHGKGADMGASFGSGASQTMFGSGGSGNFLTRSTTLMTVVFFVTSMSLAVIAKDRAEQGIQDDSLISGDINQLQQEESQQAPVDEDIPTVANEGGDDVPVLSEESSGSNAEETSGSNTEESSSSSSEETSNSNNE